MTPIEPLRKLQDRRTGGASRRGPDPKVDLAMVVGLVLGLLLLRRRLGRALTERTGTWVGTIR